MVAPMEYLCIFVPKSIKTKTMKKKNYLLPLFTLGICMTLTSCFENSGDHLTQIFYPETGRKTLYADQIKDSLIFVTFDDWKLDTVYSQLSDNQKLKLTLNADDLSGSVPQNHYVRRCVEFTFSPNTSDTIRAVAFNLNSYTFEVGAVYEQVHFHNIERPLRRNYEFLLTDTAEAAVDSVIFEAYTDWTLKVKDAEQNNWISVANPSGTKGNNIVRLNLQKNTSNANRSAILLLTSDNNAQTEIRLTQQKAKEK